MNGEGQLVSVASLRQEIGPISPGGGTFVGDLARMGTSFDVSAIAFLASTDPPPPWLPDPLRIPYDFVERNIETIGYIAGAAVVLAIGYIGYREAKGWINLLKGVPGAGAAVALGTNEHPKEEGPPDVSAQEKYEERIRETAAQQGDPEEKVIPVKKGGKWELVPAPKDNQK